jgi:hypothetical protein
MENFWSWQSDTHGKTGRHFVRECLADAIAIVNQPIDVDEPSEQERRDPVELDQERVGSSASRVHRVSRIAAVDVSNRAGRSTSTPAFSLTKYRTVANGCSRRGKRT